MFDLCAVAQRRFYAPSTRSLLSVPPALMRHCLSATDLPPTGVRPAACPAWNHQPDGLVAQTPKRQTVDPYDPLPRIFTDLPGRFARMRLTPIRAKICGAEGRQRGGKGVAPPWYLRKIRNEELMPVGMRHAIGAGKICATASLTPLPW